MLFQDTRLQVDSSCLTTPFFNINGITVVVAELSRLAPDFLRVDDLILCLIVVHLMPRSLHLTDYQSRIWTSCYFHEAS